MKNKKREWEKRNRQHIKEYNRQYYLKNKEKINKASKTWQKNNKERSLFLRRKSLLKLQYGLSLEEAETLYSKGCEICGGKVRLCIDHDHKTGKVRGCLCMPCNTYLGKIKDSVLVAKRLYAYVKERCKL